MGCRGVGSAGLIYPRYGGVFTMSRVGKGKSR